MFINQKSDRQRKVQWLVFLLISVVLYQIASLAWVTDGFQAFTYTLDDPYIHLKVAKNIVLGHYGFNLSENSSPSSSILWPFLLAPFATFSFFEYVPFVFNFVLILCLAATVFDLFVTLKISLPAAYLLSLILLFFINVFGLALNGLEHVLQVLCVALIAKQFIAVMSKKSLSFPVLIGLVTLGILIRYEMLVFWAAAVGYHTAKKEVNKAFLIAILPLVPAILFSFFLSSMGLGVLPSSVLAKAASDSNVPLSLLSTFVSNVSSRQGLGILFLTIINVFLARRCMTLSWSVFALLAIPSLLHLLVGKFGWFYRYEVYILTYVLLTFVFLVSRFSLKKWHYAISFVVLYLLCEPYILSTRLLRQASRNIRFQQGVTADFMSKYLTEPIGLNDIGLPGFRYSYKILDLWGLASQDALNRRLRSRNHDWISEIAQQQSVQILFVYESWLQPSSEWRKVGEFHLLEKNVVLGGDTVAVFALEDRVSKLKSDLIAFREEIKDVPVEVRIY